MSKPVSIEVSKRVYDHILSELKRINQFGTASSALKKYSGAFFTDTPFEVFLKGPQDKESLVALLDDLERIYSIAFCSEQFRYNMSLFKDDSDNRIDLLESQIQKIKKIINIDAFNELLETNELLKKRNEDLEKRNKELNEKLDIIKSVF